MVRIELDDQEADLLHDVLQSCVHDLEIEIAHTDRREFKGLLKSKETLLQRLLGELEEAVEKKE